MMAQDLKGYSNFLYYMNLIERIRSYIGRGKDKDISSEIPIELITFDLKNIVPIFFPDYARVRFPNEEYRIKAMGILERSGGYSSM